jgi:hypothetical protein
MRGYARRRLSAMMSASIREQKKLRTCLADCGLNCGRWKGRSCGIMREGVVLWETKFFGRDTIRLLMAGSASES